MDNRDNWLYFRNSKTEVHIVYQQTQRNLGTELKFLFFLILFYF